MSAETEEWRGVVGVSGYEVSSLGSVRSWRPPNGRDPRSAPRMLKPWLDRDGYRKVNVGRQRMVHALVLEAFVGPRPDGAQCCHNNGDPSDNRVCNLRWDSCLENARDRIRHGTQARGEGHGSKTAPSTLPRGDAHWTRTRPEDRPFGSRHPRAKLHESDIPGIRAAEGRYEDIGRPHGISKHSVCLIKKRKTWAHVP